MRRPIIEAGRQLAGGRIAPSIGQLRFKDAGSAGAQEHPETAPIPAPRRPFDRLVEAVLTQSELREAVVPAIEPAESGGQRLRVDARHLAQVGAKIHRLEAARLETAAPFAQGGERRLEAPPDADSSR